MISSLQSPCPNDTINATLDITHKQDETAHHLNIKEIVAMHNNNAKALSDFTSRENSDEKDSPLCRNAKQKQKSTSDPIDKVTIALLKSCESDAPTSFADQRSRASK